MNAAIIRRLAALKIDSEAMSEVLSIIADIQSVSDERKAKDRERKRNIHGNSTEIPRNVHGNSTQKAPPSLSPLIPPPHPPPISPQNPPPAKNARERASVSVEFENEFWPAYPHKVGKADAQKAFVKARARSELPALIAGLRNYIATKPADRPWCNPSTWLNQDRWLDQPAATGPNVLPFGGPDPPPRKQLTRDEQIAIAKKFDDDYRAGRIP